MPANMNILSTMKLIPAELNLGGTSTAEKVFQNSASAAIVLPLPSAGQLCGGTGSQQQTAHFKVLAMGRVTGGTTTNFTVKLYYGTSTTTGSDTQIAASTARAVNSVSANWMIEANLVWDAASNKIGGYQRAMVNNLYDAEAALTGAVSSADPDNSSVQGFVVSGTFSSGNASNAAYLDTFVLISIA